MAPINKHENAFAEQSVDSQRGPEDPLMGLSPDDDAMENTTLEILAAQAIYRKHTDELSPSATVEAELSRLMEKVGAAPTQSLQSETADEARQMKFSMVLRWMVGGVAASLLLLTGYGWMRERSATDIAQQPVAKLDKPTEQSQPLPTSPGSVLPTPADTDADTAPPTVFKQFLRALGYSDNAQVKKTEEHTLASEPGQWNETTLPDGSRVWLYADSKLTYPQKFVGPERVVYLEGQAHFDVTHDPTHPFHIITDRIDTRVLGTEINVSCYPGETPHVALLRGKVEVGSKDGTMKVVLKPGQGVSLQPSGLLDVAEEDMVGYEYWKGGYFFFNDKPLGEIAAALGRWYHVKVVFDSAQVADKRLRFFCQRTDDLHRAVKLLNSFGGFEIKTTGEELHIK